MKGALVRIENCTIERGTSAVVYVETLDAQGRWSRDPAATPPVFLNYPTAQVPAALDATTRLVIELEGSAGQQQDQVLLKLADLQRLLYEALTRLERPTPGAAQ